MAKKPNLWDVFAFAKAQLLTLVREGRVPVDVPSFGALSAYIDENELGGFCDDEKADEWIEAFGGRDPVHEGLPDGYNEFIDLVQKQIDVWIKGGGLKKEHKPCVWLLLVTEELTTNARVFAKLSGARGAGIFVINEYRNNSKVADQIDEVLAEFERNGKAGDGNATFYVEIECAEIE